MSTFPKKTEDVHECPGCGGEVSLVRPHVGDEVTCVQCGNLLWFVRKTTKDAVLVTFLRPLK